MVTEQSALLRAMADDYINGHSWDELDSIACKKAADEIERQAARIAELEAREVPEWISVDDRLPEIGAWVNVLYDSNLGDYFDRQNSPRYSVYGAQLREVDSDGHAMWQRWQMSDGGPMSPLYLVSHWMPLPAAPSPANSGEVKP